MKKVLKVLFLLAMLLTVSSINATETRVLTMGDNNMLLLDEANIFLFPSRIYEWPDLAVGEFGDSEFSEFGLHMKFGSKAKPWYVGTYFHNNTPADPVFSESPFYNDPFNLGYNFGANEDFIPFDNALLSNKRLDMIYGRKLGKNNFGFHFGMIHSSQRNDIPSLGVPNEGKDEESYAFYTFNTGMTFNEGKLDLAFGVDFMTFNDKATTDDGVAYYETKPEGNHKIHFTGRSFHLQNKKYTLIPHFLLSYAKYEARFASETDKYTHSIADLGVGLQYTPVKNVLAVLDFGLNYDKLKGEFTPTAGVLDQASVKTFTMPYFKVGFDADVFKWMDIRLGATSYWKNETYENVTTNGEHIRNYADNETFLGFGFHWNRLHVDTQTDPDLFLRGFDFINGKDNNRNMNFRISFVYEMK